MNTSTFSVECKRYFIESKTRFTKDGKPKRFPVIIRKLFVRGSFVGTNEYRIVYQPRQGQSPYCISYVRLPAKELWPLPKLNLMPVDVKWNRDCRMNEPQFVLWLGRLIGKEQAGRAFVEFMNAEIEERQAA